MDIDLTEEVPRPSAPAPRPTTTATATARRPAAAGSATATATARRPGPRARRTPADPSTASAPPSAPRARIDGLDGLRAIAVIGVLLYHADVPWAFGGFIGVDVFFVLSGYLVTGIVLSSIQRTGGLGFGRFWSGRLRRLAPAQVAMISVITIAVALFASDELSTMRGQVIAAFTGTMNWYLIATNGSYFEQLGRPPVLRHLWSLAIELQFYLVFPLVLVVMMRRWSDRLDRIVSILLGATLASTLYLAILFHPGGDPSRAYYDTFARLAAPLLGAVLAIVWRPDALRRGEASRIGPAVAGVGAVALVGLVWLMHAASDRSAFMYRGGFLIVAVLSALVVAAIVHPSSWLGSHRALANPVLVAIGLRSYAIYLWHWPVFVLLRPGIDVGWSWGFTFWVRLVVTLLLAECSYRLVERPWHLRSPGASFAGIKRNVLAPRGVPTSTRLATLGAIGLVVVAVILVVPSRPANDEIADTLAAGQAALDSSGSPDAKPTTTVAGATTTVPDPAKAPEDQPLVADDGRVTLVGDSVMLGSAPALLDVFGDSATIDAKVGRQAAQLAPEIRQLDAQGLLGATLVVQVGINGTVTEEDLRAVSAAAPGRRLIVINSRVPRSWQDENNRTVASIVPKLPHASVVDWYKRSANHRDWYLDDGVHLDDAGRAEYAKAISAAVDKARATKSTSKSND